jgi:hypothetical protein
MLPQAGTLMTCATHVERVEDPSSLLVYRSSGGLDRDFLGLK